MAEELRWEKMVGSVADAATGSNADNEFRNTTDEIMHIRRISRAVRVTVAAPGEEAVFEISKSPTYMGATDGTPFFARDYTINAPPAGATPADGDAFDNGTELFAKGQLTLEPNESLFVNVLKSSGGNALYIFDIGYHF